jgi:hypothetical protein
MHSRLPLAPLLLALFATACGGTAVVEAGAGGAGSGATSTSTTDASATGVTATSTSTGGGACASHTDCPGELCIFATGQCAPACSDGICPSCGPGLVCETCATSSCPGCDDCLGACAPATPDRCDDDDPCAPGSVCLWYYRVCAPGCETDMDCGGFAYCDGCATSSCCGCADCASACIGGE